MLFCSVMFFFFHFLFLGEGNRVTQIVCFCFKAFRGQLNCIKFTDLEIWKFVI